MIIDAIQQFHIELLGISKLGIPLNLGFDRAGKDLATALDEIAATIKQTVRDDQGLAESISNVPHLSPAYRKALAVWLATEGSPIAFESLVAPAAARQQTRRIWDLSLLQPLVILAISYLVMIYVCNFTIPRLEAIYEQTGHRPHFALAIMIAIRKSMFIWIPMAPVVLAIVYLFRKKRREASSAKPATSVSLRWGERNLYAVSAEQLAELLKSHVSLPAALDIVQSDRPTLVPRLQPGNALSWRLCLPRRRGSSNPAAGGAGNSLGSQAGAWEPGDDVCTLRPLMRWAVSEESEGLKIRSLQWAAATYRNLSRTQSHKIRNWLPPIAMGILGGCLVLGVGLSVFWPIAELLYDLSKPGASR